MRNFIKKIFNKTFFILSIVVFALCLFFFWGWFEKQYYKCVGMYYVYKGDKAYHHGKLQDAIDNYNRGLELYPGHYGARFNLGNIYVVFEDYYSAVDAYEKAIEDNKNFTLARMNLGIISSEKLGDFDGAITQYQAIIDTKQHLWFIPFIFVNTRSEKVNKGLAYYNMGVAYRKKSLYSGGDGSRSIANLSKAIEAYKNAVKILNKDYDSRYNLALAYHLSGDYQNAGMNYCKAIYLAPMNYEAHYNLAILLKHLKKYKEAYSELEKATILVSSDSSGSNLTSYVFDILNNISQSLVANNEYNYLIENVDDKPSGDTVTSVNGKIVATDALDRAILENFKTCDSKEYFENFQ